PSSGAATSELSRHDRQSSPDKLLEFAAPGGGRTPQITPKLRYAALPAPVVGNAPANHSCCAAQGVTTTMAPSVTEKSLYQLDSTWTNDFGTAVKLVSLRGRPQIVTMFFANCAYACPLLVFQMQQIEAALPEPVRSQMGFTLVSFDTERDTPEALHNY